MLEDYTLTLVQLPGDRLEAVATAIPLDVEEDLSRLLRYPSLDPAGGRRILRPQPSGGVPVRRDCGPEQGDC